MTSGKFITFLALLTPLSLSQSHNLSVISPCLEQCPHPLVLTLFMRMQLGSKLLFLFVKHLQEFIGRVHRPLLKVALDRGFETGEQFNVANVTQPMGPSIKDVTQMFHIFGCLPPFHCPIHATYSNITALRTTPYIPLVLMLFMRRQPGLKLLHLFRKHLQEFIGRVHRPLLKVALDGGFETGEQFNLANIA